MKFPALDLAAGPALEGWLQSLSPWLETLWIGVLVHLWQTTLVLALVALLALLLRDAPARFQSRLWWAGLAKLFLPVALLSQLLQLLPGSGAVPGAADSGVLVSVSFVLDPTLWAAGPTSGGIAGALLFVGLTVAWTIGGLWFALRWRRAAAHRDAGSPGAATTPASSLPTGLRERLRQALDTTGIAASRIVVTDAPVLPSVRGLFRPRLVIPRRLIAHLEPVELRGLLLHEDAHRRRLDPLRDLVKRVAVILFHFYPPLWPLLRRLSRSDELACDEAALAAGVPPATYSRALARTLGLDLLVAAPVALFGHGRSLLGDRLHHLDSPARSAAMRKHHVAVVAAVAVVILGSVVPLGGTGTESALAGSLEAVAGASGVPVQPEPAPDLGIEGLQGAEARVSAEYADLSLVRVLEDLAAQGGFNVVVDEHLATEHVSLVLVSSSIAEALERIASATHVVYRVPRPGLLRVIRAQRIGGRIQAPEKVHHVDPVYPEEAREQRLEGVVILEAIVGTAGDVRDVVVLRGVTPSLDRAAIDAVRQWRYAPTYVDGEPLPVKMIVTVQFALQPQRPHRGAVR